MPELASGRFSICSIGELCMFDHQPGVIHARQFRVDSEAFTGIIIPCVN